MTNKERMTLERLRELYSPPPGARRTPRDEEHALQCTCVRWFRYEHSDMAELLFAVPNGGRRDKQSGARLKAEGVLAGVSDLILMLPNSRSHALCVEMKTTEGRQSEAQKLWQFHVEAVGYEYRVCRSVDDFIETVENYIKG